MDHPFIVDKSLFDIVSSDLRELWDTEIEPHEFKIEDDWNTAGSPSQPKSQIVLNDRLMSEALISSDAPIKTEHSYCSQLSVVCSSPLHSDLIPDDDEDDLMSTIDIRNTRSHSQEEPFIIVKAEPMSEPCSPASSCPSPPSPISRTNHDSSDDCDRKITTKSIGKIVKKHCSSSTSGKIVGVKRKRQIMLANMIRIDPSTSHSRFPLPPTPPSCASSDNEGNISPPYLSLPTQNLFNSAATTTRQPIQTSLISTQPKGSTGILLLTEEEKRTLMAEGYPIPSRLPLTKAEEKCLKKIRRKIKNKISAQESRRKKKEYMDALEKKVQVLSSENTMYRRQISSLEGTNSNLLSQVAKLQGIIALLGGPLSSKNTSK